MRNLFLLLCHRISRSSVALRPAFAVAFATFVVCLLALPARADELKSIAILDFELIDEQRELAPATVEHARLERARRQLVEEFAGRGLYRVLDLAPAAALIAKHKSEQRLHECNGCEVEIAQALQADRVLVGWVQKVSNLILNINIQIEDGRSGAVLLNKSVDLRGNTDESWRRGVSYLVRDMVDKGQGNR